MNRRRVTLPGRDIAHVIAFEVFCDGTTNPALCGAYPRPGQWQEAGGGQRMCAACGERLRAELKGLNR